METWRSTRLKPGPLHEGRAFLLSSPAMLKANTLVKCSACNRKSAVAHDIATRLAGSGIGPISPVCAGNLDVAAAADEHRKRKSPRPEDGPILQSGLMPGCSLVGWQALGQCSHWPGAELDPLPKVHCSIF